jgi:hypothetical protein
MKHEGKGAKAGANEDSTSGRHRRHDEHYRSYNLRLRANNAPNAPMPEYAWRDVPSRPGSPCWYQNDWRRGVYYYHHRGRNWVHHVPTAADPAILPDCPCGDCQYWGTHGTYADCCFNALHALRKKIVVMEKDRKGEREQLGEHCRVTTATLHAVQAALAEQTNSLHAVQAALAEESLRTKAVRERYSVLKSEHDALVAYHEYEPGSPEYSPSDSEPPEEPIEQTCKVEPTGELNAK